MLNKTYYFDDAHFGNEQAEIFSSTWIFACLKSEVSANSDFVTFDVAGIPVVVQNFKGELRAFQNICSHRFNKIQTEPFGRRALTCGYHCWSFDKEGFPSFIPKKAQFTEFNDEAVIQENFCLRKFHLDTCGNFVFICMAEERPVALVEHLGVYCHKLEEISLHIGSKTHFGVLKHQANWKILVENVLECYHCSIVHNSSLYGKLGIGGLPVSDIELTELHSSCHFPKVKKKSDEKKRKVLAFLDERSFKHDSFYHIYIFPNLVISSTEGASFYVGQLAPNSAGETDLKVRFLEPNLDYSNVNAGIREILAEESVKLGYEILEEDRAILENIQKGIVYAQGPGIINTEEIRIKYFFDAYLKAMNVNG